jgi:hypothetical protein
MSEEIQFALTARGASGSVPHVTAATGPCPARRFPFGVIFLNVEGSIRVKDAGKLALVFLCGTVAIAQPRTISARAGTINYQRGAIYVDDQLIPPTYGNHPPFQMRNGQRLRIDTGRVELLLGEGVYLRMLGPSAIRMQETQLADTRVVLESGSALIEVAGMNKDAKLRVTCGESSTELRRDGSYRFDAPAEALAGKLRIYGGDATVERDGVAVKARTGLAVALAAGLQVSRFNLADADTLQAWSARRSQRRIDGERRQAEARAMQIAKRRAQIEVH